MAVTPVVRITGGVHAGRRLRGAAGATRPATARLRRSIFDRPDVQDALQGPVLDLYAGAGLLGLEALSRGAPRVDFVERDRAACAVIRGNLESLGCLHRAGLHCRAAERTLATLPPGYTLCFADPPYAVDATDVLRDVLERALLDREALLLWRYPRARAAPAVLTPAAAAPGAAGVGPPSLVRVDQRRYGDAVLDTFVAAADRAAAPAGGRGAP
jgi:16S rRNA (guanine(966)-N(2))-methyltransferase RsmD